MKIYNVIKINQFLEKESFQTYSEKDFFEVIKEDVFKSQKIQFVDGVAVFQSGDYTFNIIQIDLTKLKLWELKTGMIKVLEESQEYELLLKLYPGIEQIIDDTEYFFHFQDAKDVAVLIFREIVKNNTLQSAN